MRLTRRVCTGKRLLVREAIGKALGSRGTGYFCREEMPAVTAPERFLDFGQMRNEYAYRKAVADLYKDSRGAFLTPSELFAPWYSYAIASWVLSCVEVENDPIRIIEFGGGSGTFALHFLNYFKSAAPNLYERVSYLDIDVSESMLKDAAVRNERHGTKFQTARLDASSFDQAALLSNCDSSHPVFVLALELCDNLPHDKVRWTRSSSDGNWTATHQAVVVDNEERFEPLTDEWIQIAAQVVQPPPLNSLVDTFSSFIGRRRDSLNAFVFTGALQWLANIRDTFPRHRLLIADFDALPSAQLSSASTRRDTAHNAPLVAPVKHQHDLPSYLDALDGSADIFFATDFTCLQAAYSRLAVGKAEPNRQPPRILKASEFFRPYAAPCTTRSGYNPLISDFSNTSVLLRD